MKLEVISSNTVVMGYAVIGSNEFYINIKKSKCLISVMGFEPTTQHLALASNTTKPQLSDGLSLS